MKEFLRDEDGQAVVEYILAVLMAMSIVAVIGKSFKSTVLKLWQMIARDVSAACPGCTPDQTVRFR